MTDCQGILFKQRVQFRPFRGFGFQTREVTMSKQILSKCWSIRNAAISLLLITIFTWQFMAIHRNWSELEKTNIDDGPPKPRVAIVAFITGPQTYVHLGLQNKDRTQS
jgi:mannan polymerase II complex MNN10 subunit